MIAQTVNKEEIQNLGLQAVKNYLTVDQSKIADKTTLGHFLSKAKIGLQFEKEMNLNKRSVEMNQIRIFKLTAEDRTEMKSLFKKTMPQYFKGVP